MYSPKIDPDQIQILYHIVKAKNAEGKMYTMTSLVKEIIGRFIAEQPQDEQIRE